MLHFFASRIPFGILLAFFVAMCYNKNGIQLVFWRILQGFQKSDGKVGLYVLIIRSVKTAEQIQELADLANKIWNEYFVKILSKEQIAYMVEQFQSNAALTKQIEEGYQYYFVIDDTEVIGYFGICKKPDDTMFLSKFYLSGEHRGKGYASQMFQFIKEKALEQRCSNIWLTVNRYNQQAIVVYEHFGMQCVQKQVTDIGNGFVMDDFVYRYTL